MTQEDKNLLLQDLSARSPYGVKAYIKNWSKLDQKYYEGVYTVESVHPSLNNIYATTENGSVEVILGYSDYVIMPYLFPLSSMTEEIMDEIYSDTGVYDIDVDSPVHIEVGTTFEDLTKISDILHKHHIDYRNLIEKGLAIDATGKNIYEDIIQEQKDLLLQIPNKLDNTVCLYVDGVFVDRFDVNQVNQYRINILKYINETGDSSILNRFYFVGYKDTNTIPGEEIKMEMDNKGNFSDFPLAKLNMSYDTEYNNKL